MKTIRNDLSEHDLKSISILQKTCKIDYDNHIVKIPLHFNNVKEIADNAISDEECISIGSGFVNGLKTKISTVPHTFKVDFNITIDDTNGHSHKDIMNALQEKMEEQYNVSSQNKKTLFYKVIAYIIVCVIVTLLKTLTFTVDYAVGVTDAYSNIINVLINSVAALFLCQATYTLFDIVARRKKEDGALFKRINSISFLQDKKKVLTRKSDELFEYWPYQKLREKIAYGLIIFNSGYVMTICAVEMILFLTSQIELNQIDKILYSTQWIFIIFIIYTNTSFYFGKGDISKHTFAISVAYFLILTVYNAIRLVVEQTYGIPFDSDHFLFTYQALSLVNIVCIEIIQKERNIRIEHIKTSISKNK